MKTAARVLGGGLLGGVFGFIAGSALFAWGRHEFVWPDHRLPLIAGLVAVVGAVLGLLIASSEPMKASIDRQYSD